MEFHMRRKPARTKSKTLMVCGVWLPSIVYRGRKAWAVLAKSWGQVTCKNCTRIHESKKRGLMVKLTREQLHEAALDAIDYVAIANYDYRQAAAHHWLTRMWNGKTDMSIDEVSEMLEEQLEQARQENLK